MFHINYLSKRSYSRSTPHCTHIRFCDSPHRPLVDDEDAEVADHGPHEEHLRDPLADDAQVVAEESASNVSCILISKKFENCLTSFFFINPDLTTASHSRVFEQKSDDVRYIEHGTFTV